MGEWPVSDHGAFPRDLPLPPDNNSARARAFLKISYVPGTVLSI